MTTEIKGVHYEIEDRIRDYIDKKISRLDFARDLLVELPITITRGTKDGFDIETNVHFRWGKSTHIGVKDYDVMKGIDSLFDKLEEKIGREKTRIQHHKGEATVRTGEVEASGEE